MSQGLSHSDNNYVPHFNNVVEVRDEKEETATNCIQCNACVSRFILLITEPTYVVEDSYMKVDFVFILL